MKLNQTALTPHIVLLIECLAIAAFCLVVYLANGKAITSNDNIPNSLLAFNLLEHQTLHLDALRGGQYYPPVDIVGEVKPPYFLVEAANGHLTSAYPIGAAIISYPLYLLFFAYIRLSAWLPALPNAIAGQDLTLAFSDPAFNGQRLFWEKLAGASLTAIAVAVFYMAARLNFGRGVALMGTFIYAFATLNWVVSSQSLYQHTVTNVALVCVMLALLKANRTSGSLQAGLLFAAGFLNGLIPVIRPTGYAITVLVAGYSLWAYGWRSRWLLLGSLSVALQWLWNVYYFSSNLKEAIAGGYGELLPDEQDTYIFAFDYVWEAFWGLLISPSKGILVFSPILLFTLLGLYQVWRHRRSRDGVLLLVLASLFIIFQINYSLYFMWWGAITYGQRFSVDLLAIACYLICYAIADLFIWMGRGRRSFILISVVFWACLIGSTSVQAIGAFSENYVWELAPISSSTPWRLWDWQDSPIERHARNLWSMIHPPIPDPTGDRKAFRQYKQQVQGVLIDIRDDSTGKPLPDPLVVRPQELLTLNAQVKNQGQSRWYGVEAGIVRGEMLVDVQFGDTQNNVDKTRGYSQLYFLDTRIEPQETAAALGQIRTPLAPGSYRMELTLKARGLGRLPRAESLGQIDVAVTNRIQESKSRSQLPPEF